MADGMAEFMRTHERPQRIWQVAVDDDVLDPVIHCVVSERRLHGAVQNINATQVGYLERVVRAILAGDG